MQAIFLHRDDNSAKVCRVLSLMHAGWLIIYQQQRVLSLVRTLQQNISVVACGHHVVEQSICLAQQARIPSSCQLFIPAGYTYELWGQAISSDIRCNYIGSFRRKS